MWDKQNIEYLIQNQIEEDSHLEYKAAAALDKGEKKIEAMSKHVSAFANSDGGVIIYGVKEYDEREKRHKPEKIDWINGIEFSGEWLSQVIGSNISPRINGVKIIPY